MSQQALALHAHIKISHLRISSGQRQDLQDSRYRVHLRNPYPSTIEIARRSHVV